MSSHLSILEEVISDVGYWRWWAEALPEVFQIEFGGVQLHFPAASPKQPPNTGVALRFVKPSLVAFLTDEEASSVNPNWRMALHRGECEPFSVHREHFTLTSEDALQSIASGCSIKYLVGTRLEATAESDKALLAFRAGEVGMVVRAKSMASIALAGELSPAQVENAASDWWTYWREYWNRRNSESPMPRDYACEVTIPLK